LTGPVAEWIEQRTSKLLSCSTRSHRAVRRSASRAMTSSAVRARVRPRAHGGGTRAPVGLVHAHKAVAFLYGPVAQWIDSAVFKSALAATRDVCGRSRTFPLPGSIIYGARRRAHNFVSAVDPLVARKTIRSEACQTCERQVECLFDTGSGSVGRRRTASLQQMWDRKNHSANSTSGQTLESTEPSARTVAVVDNEPSSSPHDKRSGSSAIPRCFAVAGVECRNPRANSRAEAATQTDCRHGARPVSRGTRQSVIKRITSAR
jgi:hypothetical protein